MKYFLLVIYIYIIYVDFNFVKFEQLKSIKYFDILKKYISYDRLDIQLAI